MATRFSDHVLKIMNVSGYHAGDNILVEVDIGNPVTDKRLMKYWMQKCHYEMYTI